MGGTVSNLFISKILGQRGGLTRFDIPRLFVCPHHVSKMSYPGQYSGLATVDVIKYRILHNFPLEKTH